MRARRLAVGFLALGLIGTACGARVPSNVRSQAARVVLSGNTGTAQQSGQAPSVGGASPGAAGQSTSNPGAPSNLSSAQPGTPGQPGSSGRPSAQGGQSTSPGSQKGTSPGSANCGTGTDVGLTSSTITLGLVATLTGPVNGLFEGAVQGGEAFANYVNNAGGICGHAVSVDAADDGTNCSQNQNVTSSLIAKTFALVGSFSLYDGCGATVIKAHPTVPDVHLALDAAAQTPPNHFDISSAESGYATGMFHYYAQKYGSKVKHVGTIVENIPSAVSNQDNMEHSAESQGWKFTNSVLESPTTSNFESDMVKMCQQGHIQIFFLLTEPAQNAATIMQNERQAGCHGVINIVPIAYDQAFISDFGSPVSALNGIQGWNEYALFFNKDEAANIPEVKLFQEWFARSYPGKPANLYAMYAWASNRLFQYAFEHAGKTTNRKTVLAALRKVKNFSANGLIAPRDPGQKAGVHCYILWQLENGQFSRIDDPKSTYRCDGKFLPRNGG